MRVRSRSFRNKHVCDLGVDLRLEEQNLLPDRKKTTTTELTMENQWIWTSLMVRYVSHRDAHFTSLAWGHKPALVELRAVRNHTAAGATDTHLPVDRVGEEDLVFLRGVDLLGGGATGLRQDAGVVCDVGLQI